jgi:branched-chain amino acid transport system ATP-binding protein
MSAHALNISSVSRRFGGLRAVDRVSFSVPRGEIMGLIGPNGSGKTTLLNVIMGRLAPSDGTILKDGKRLSGRTPEQICRLGVAGTFQLVRVPDALNARDNVAVAAMYGKRKIGVSAARAEAERLLDRVQFEGSLEAHADQLTYFDQKRIELARALACSPDVLLLDEWLAGLNPSELERGIELVHSLKNEGITVVMVEHVMHAIRSLCSYVVVLSAGKLIASGTPDDALANPEVIRVYLGDDQ